MQKKLAIVLAAAFAVFFALGIALNSQQGAVFSDQFWKLKKDGSYACGKDWIRSGGGEFEMFLDGKTLTAQQSSLSDGILRMDYSDGWAVEGAYDSGFLFAFSGLYAGSDAELILTDMEAQDFVFAAAAKEERYPFYDAGGEKEIGETIHILSENGDMLDYREVWFDAPTHNSPEREIIVLKEGARLPGNPSMSNCILMNAAGEYLVHADSIGMLRAGGADVHRADLAFFLYRIEQGKPESRGSAAPVAGFVLLYLLGAAQMIWPQQLAFLGSRWQFKNEPELSDAGIIAARIGGAVVMLIGVIMMFVGL